MSSSDSEDNYNFYDYCERRFYFRRHRNGAGPPLIKKKSRIISAVVQNQVEALSELLDSPRWYNVRDVNGNGLLHIAIHQDNIEVFDYLLSIPDFPLDSKNKKGQSALIIALHDHSYRQAWMLEHFAYELVKKGARIDEDDYEENIVQTNQIASERLESTLA
ncbi:uncharacterized protein LOC135123335 isoform X2 [Zophobas morio]|uniref:uncharacterized protein LOC135123335 isoform X2 n=1 Tax=Zophobas morio TaxID=2755281 RepID=UPI003083E6B8